MYEFWAKDSAEKAVLSAKSSDQILVILVEGKDELSDKVCSAFNEGLPGIQSSARDGFNFIGLRVSEGTANYEHFTRIYSKVDVLKEPKTSVRLKVPCVMFIGAMGLPLAVIEVTNFETFPDRLNNTFIKFHGTGAKEAVDLVYEQYDKTDQYAHPMYKAYKMANEAISGSKKKNQLTSDETVSAVNKVEVTSDSFEGRLKSDDDLINANKTNEKMNACLHQQTKDTSPISACKNEKDMPNGNAVVQRHRHETRETKILFRLQNGKMISETFPFSTQLKEVRQYVKEQLGIRSFNLTFLARLKEEDELLTLEQLNMVPSAVLLIIPVAGGEQSLIKKGFSRLATFFWYLAMPVITYLQYLNNFLFGGHGRQDRRGGSSSSSLPPPPPSGGSGPRHSSSQNRSNSNKYRTSNIHTLRSMNDDDSSQNTYNGNSTQQMP